ncbi:hypothetical protein BKA80DRAFT_87706 [Phyllosticta citrichinensis]
MDPTLRCAALLSMSLSPTDKQQQHHHLHHHHDTIDAEPALWHSLTSAGAGGPGQGVAATEWVPLIPSVCRSARHHHSTAQHSTAQLPCLSQSSCRVVSVLSWSGLARPSHPVLLVCPCLACSGVSRGRAPLSHTRQRHRVRVVRIRRFEIFLF